MMVRTIQIAALLCLLSPATLAQSLSDQPMPQAAPQGPLQTALAIEDPTDRIAALTKFLKTNTVIEQSQTAREALVASYAQLGEAQLADNNIERATADFRRAIGHLPEHSSATFFEETAIRIPLAVSVRGYRNEAILLARLLESHFAAEESKLARIGEFYLTTEAPADAIRALEAAAKLAPEDATLQRALGSAYRMGLRLDDAVAAYQQAINLDPKDKRAYYELGNLYRAHGAYADAIKLYRKQLEIEPKYAPSYKGLALAFLAQGNEREATAALDQARAVRGAPEEVTQDIHLQTQLAFIYLSQNKLKQARAATDAALYIEPRYAWARIAAAEIELAEGNFFEAERQLLAAKTYATFPSLYFTLGKVYLMAEDFDGAVEQFSKVISYSPNTEFTTKLGGTLDVQSDNLRDLLARERQAAIFLAEAPTTDEQFKIAESLMKFNTRLRMLKSLASPAASRSVKGQPRPRAEQTDESRRQQMEALDQAAMSFIEAENSRRAFRMLYIAQQLAQAGVDSGLAVELSDQAVGLSDAATEFNGSVRDYPNYDRDGRLKIFRGRALDAKGWALFKSNKNEEAAAALNESIQAYGSLPEANRAKRHLATVKESSGQLKEALDLYIASYERPEASSVDLNRAVIESLYRKVNGSLEGLDKLIGAPLSNELAVSKPAPTVKSNLNKPANKTGLIKPAIGPTVSSQPNSLSSPSVNEPENKPELNQPENKPALSQPENKPAPSEPGNKADLNQPESKPAPSEPENKPDLNQPENNSAPSQPESIPVPVPAKKEVQMKPILPRWQPPTAPTAKDAKDKQPTKKPGLRSRPLEIIPSAPPAESTSVADPQPAPQTPVTQIIEPTSKAPSENINATTNNAATSATTNATTNAAADATAAPESLKPVIEPVKPAPVEIPGIEMAADVPLAPAFDQAPSLQAFENFLNKLISADDEQAPPAPSTERRVHTRKRRVTPPDNPRL